MKQRAAATLAAWEVPAIRRTKCCSGKVEKVVETKMVEKKISGKNRRKNPHAKDASDLPAVNTIKIKKKHKYNFISQKNRFSMLDKIEKKEKKIAFIFLGNVH
jgi:hypothetical protein